ncbi:DUF4132 domain-containing protein [Streptomyces sp. YC504]|uniref:DUF4132 domain-containing protein n=1 Tax=Streptomyces mesophilus TaxID=1775132 RepID=A0A6G4XVU0_9ACTN|nr:DUF4132 domain-containing protein [Streptomyces mesophilus]
MVHTVDRIERVRKFAAEGAIEQLAVELLERGPETIEARTWTGYDEETLDVVRALRGDAALTLAQSLVTLTGIYSLQAGCRIAATALLGVIDTPMPDDPFAYGRFRRLETYGRLHSTWAESEMTVLARAELDVGGSVPAAVVATMRRSLTRRYIGGAHAEELTALLDRITDPVVNPGEAWSDRALTDMADAGADWQALVRHALTAAGARPTAAWEKSACLLTELLPEGQVRERITTWLGLVGQPRTVRLFGGEARINDEFDPYNADALRGLIWTLSLLPAHRDTVRTLGTLAETCLRKLPGLGPRSPKLANAAVTSLARMEGEPALAELARLSARITYKGTLKQLHTALDAKAKALGLTREEIEELAVPAYGLNEVGRATHQLGDCAADLTVMGSQATLTWRNPAGKTLKAPPAQVKRDHPDELKELKAAVKDIDKMLSAQAERLDRQFLARRRWAYDKWRTQYLDHSLVGTLARRLLWTVDDRPVGYADGELRTLAGEPVTAGAEVELWHPIHHEPAEVVAWREWLERHVITQPFKQAHREVYLLTDAERNTGTYSNRFAAHILRQHQFNSLAAIRGWHAKLRLCVDDEYPPAYKELPQWGLRAEYWIEGIEGDDWTAHIADSGAYLRIRTDQVRFYPMEAPRNSAHAGSGDYRMWVTPDDEPVASLPLTDIPPLALSEVLRDVDLFVGVASVGNDPTWQDGGPEGRFQEYWSSYSFGELNASAETRRRLLTRLIPRLAIADRCTVEGRFLHVKGELHTYKIHLGSGNILRTPNDQYLCIVPKGVPAGEPAGTGYLPFEGDRVLSVILSKAMLLAKDKEITDSTITSQL